MGGRDHNQGAVIVRFARHTRDTVPIPRNANAYYANWDVVPGCKDFKCAPPRVRVQTRRQVKYIASVFFRALLPTPPPKLFHTSYETIHQYRSEQITFKILTDKDTN